MAQNPSENTVKHVKPVTNTNLFCGVSAYGPSEVASNFDELPEDNLCAENDRMHGVASGIESPDVSHDQQKELVPLIIKTEEETSFEEPSEVKSHFDGLPENTSCTESDRTQGIASGIESHNVAHDQQKELMPLKIKTEEGTSFEGYDDHFDAQEPLLVPRVIKRDVPKMKTAKIVLRKLDLRRTTSKCVDCHKVLQGSSIQCSGDATVNRRILKCNRCKKNEHKEAGHQTRDMEEDIPGVKTNHPRHGATNTMGEDFRSLTNDSDNADQPGENIAPVECVISSLNQGEMTENRAVQEEMTDSTCSKIQSRIHRDELKVDHIEMRSDESGKDDGRPYKCSKCSETFCDKIQLQRHNIEQTCVELQASQVSSKEGDQENADEPGENIASVDCVISSSNQGQMTENQTFQEEMADSTSSKIQSRIHPDELKVDHIEIRSDESGKDDGRPYKCSMCSETFCDKIQLQRHNIKQTCVKLQGSQDCSKEGDQGGDLDMHVVTQVDERPFSCSVCLKAFTHMYNLNRHMKTHTGERPFRCRICNKAYTRKHKLKVHMKTHTGESPFPCNICSKGFAYKGELTKHLRIHTGERPFTCSICSKAFIQKGGLKYHMMTHTGERPFSCSICNKAFGHKRVLTIHMRTHTGERPFNCSMCTRAFMYRCELTNHLRTHTGEKPFRCSICSKAFTYRNVLTKHLRTHTSERPFSCSICSKAFTFKCVLTRHLRTHTSDRTCSCSICGKGFAQTGDLTKHMRTHAGEKRFSCSICSKAFAQKSSLTNHMTTHTSERPFTCSICGKGFAQTGDLKKHMRAHTDERRFRCSICSKAFAQKSSLTNHMMSHTGERPVSCNICSKAFTHTGDLTRHLRTHTGERPFSCSICNKAFSQRGHLRTHMTIHTGKKKP